MFYNVDKKIFHVGKHNLRASSDHSFTYSTYFVRSQ